MEHDIPAEVLGTSARWFAVWDVTVLGECQCPSGVARESIRHAAVASPGSCDSPGKHPFWVRMVGGSSFGFPRGLRSAVPWEEYAEMLPYVRAAGGRTAAALPGDLWVLDVDSGEAFSEMVRLFKTGRLTFDRVVAAARTRRGWHVWVRTGDGWRSGTASTALGCRALEVKSGGGYVVVPDGRERHWVPVMVFAETVAAHSRTVLGWGSVPLEAAGEVGLENGPCAVVGPAGSDDDWEWAGGGGGGSSEVAMAVLKLGAEILARTREGSRNVGLNRLGFIEGRAALEAGCTVGDVVAVLRAAGRACGLPGMEVDRTVRSSLELETA